MHGRGRGRQDWPASNGSNSSSWGNSDYRNSSGPPPKDTKLDDWQTPGHSSHGDRQPAKSQANEWDDWDAQPTQSTAQQPNTSRSNLVTRTNDTKMETNWDNWGGDNHVQHQDQSRSVNQKRDFEPNERRGRERESWNNSGGRRSDSQHRERQTQQAGSTIVIRVPSGTVGRVIGKGGSKINELQDQTGAKIRVSID